MRLTNKRRRRKATRQASTVLEWCDRCDAYTADCEHQPNRIQRASDVARKVARAADAGAHLADGINQAIAGAAEILGGRWKGR